MDERRWGGLRLGDVVCEIARTRKMIVTDLDLDDPRAVTCAWRPSPRAPLVVERAFRTSTLVVVRLAPRQARDGNLRVAFLRHR